MYKSTTLLALAASLAAAASSDGPTPTSFDSTTSYSNMPSCTTSVESILAAFPTPQLQDEDLISYFQSVLGGDSDIGTNPTDSNLPNYCAITSAPSGPVQTAYASYTSAILSWSSAQAGAIKEVQSKCKGSGDPEGEIEQVVIAASIYVGEGCPGNTNAPTTASPTAAPSGSGSASGAAASPTSTKAPNAGARVTGAAAAGVLAVAAAVAMI